MTPERRPSLRHAALLATLLGARAAPSQADPWTMFHKDARHTGRATGVGAVGPGGPALRWSFAVAPGVADSSYAALGSYRWYSNFPLADLDGIPGLEVLVTGPEIQNVDPRVGRIWALRSSGPTTPVPVWSPPFFEGTRDRDTFDQYAAALVNCDADPRPDVVFTSQCGFIRALSGRTGALIWQDSTGYYIEAGPMVADLDRDGRDEIVVVTDARLDSTGSLPPICEPIATALLVYAARPLGGGTTNRPLREIPFRTKLDSEEPAIVDLAPPGGTNSQTIVFGSWAMCPYQCSQTSQASGYLYALWFDLANAGTLAGAPVRRDSISLVEIATRTGDVVDACERPEMRVSPLLWNFGAGETAVFGWMGDFSDIETSRISAVRLSYDAAQDRVVFDPRWTRRRVTLGGQEWPIMDWKPTVALLPRPLAPFGDTLVVSAGGRGSNLDTQTGDYGWCTSDAAGWVGAFRPQDGALAWGHRFTGEGNIRSSCAVGDLDGDGHYEVVVAFGCRGKLRCFGDDGTLEWEYQLAASGPSWQRRSIGSPSIGDVDGDGFDEVIVSAYDGRVVCLGGPVPVGVDGADGGDRGDASRPGAAQPILRLTGNPAPVSRGGVWATLELASASPVVWTVHDLRGRLVRRGTLGTVPPGRHEIAWDGRDARGERVGAGLYVLGVQAAGTTVRTKLVVTR